MTNKIFVCDEDINESGDDVPRVGEKGILSLVEVSKETKDKTQHLVDLTSLLIHTSCRKKYTRTQSIVADLKRALTSSESTEPARVRSSVSTFDFKKNCFFYVQSTHYFVLG